MKISEIAGSFINFMDIPPNNKLKDDTGMF